MAAAQAKPNNTGRAENFINDFMLGSRAAGSDVVLRPEIEPCAFWFHILIGHPIRSPIASIV